jgi:hypothetical protein
MNDRMQQKRATAARWAAVNPILYDGQLGIETDTGVLKWGDGVTHWLDLPIAFASRYLPLLGTAEDSHKLGGHNASEFMMASAAAGFLPATGKAVDADLLDGQDSSVFATNSTVDGRTLQASATRKLVSHWGSGTTFPLVGVLQGDTFKRSDVGTNGSYWLYSGGTSGVSGWVHKGPIVCTSTTRPPSSVCYPGLHIYETDTKAEASYDGTNWGYSPVGGDCLYKPVDGATINAPAGGNLAIPMGNAVYTTPDVTQSADKASWTLNRGGVWTLSGGYRTLASATGGVRNVINFGDIAGNPFYQTDAPTVAGQPFDLSGSMTRRFPANQTISCIIFAGAATTIDTSAGSTGGNARNFFSAVFLRP